MTYSIRPATPDDVPVLLSLVRELAAYEKQPDAVEADESMYAAALFPAQGEPRVWAHVAETDEGIVGMALWFLTFSTWTGRHGLYLEDLYVRPEHRGRGVGGRLLATLAAIAVERGYPRFEWTCLDWNEPALAVYRSLGAVPQDEWTVQRLTGPELRALASRAQGRA